MGNSRNLSELRASNYRKYINKEKTFGEILPPLMDNRKSLTEANLQRIIDNAGKYGIIIISSNRGVVASDNKNCDLTDEFNEWLKGFNLIDDYATADKEKKEELESKFLKIRNKNAYQQLYQEVRNLPYSYTQVYGGYNEKYVNDYVKTFFEPSIIVYCIDRKGNVMDFSELKQHALDWCKRFNQESVFVQAPGEAPHHLDYNGNVCEAHSSMSVKFNKPEETYFTTNKRKKRGEPQRFTSDIVYEGIIDDTEKEKDYLFENYYKIYAEYKEHMRRTQSGEEVMNLW